jgi:hypothetical protein
MGEGGDLIDRRPRGTALGGARIRCDSWLADTIGREFAASILGATRPLVGVFYAGVTFRTFTVWLVTAE